MSSNYVNARQVSSVLPIVSPSVFMSRRVRGGTNQSFSIGYGITTVPFDTTTYSTINSASNGFTITNSPSTTRNDIFTPSVPGYYHVTVSANLSVPALVAPMVVNSPNTYFYPKYGVGIDVYQTGTTAGVGSQTYIFADFNPSDPAFVSSAYVPTTPQADNVTISGIFYVGTGFSISMLCVNFAVTSTGGSNTGAVQLTISKPSINIMLVDQSTSFSNSKIYNNVTPKMIKHQRKQDRQDNASAHVPFGFDECNEYSNEQSDLSEMLDNVNIEKHTKKITKTF